MTLEEPGRSHPDDAGPATPGPRTVTDAQTLRALAHPVRIALLEELIVSGPLTATEVGERIGESPTTCSFHLRQLARYGFVEEAGAAPGRGGSPRSASPLPRAATTPRPSLPPACCSA